MDVNDLNARGMETAISQELEISMLCSSLITLNICPNLVLVSSVFQSEFPPPDFLWRSRSRIPPLLLGLGEDNIIRCYLHVIILIYFIMLFKLSFTYFLTCVFIHNFAHLYIYLIFVFLSIYFFNYLSTYLS
jgi:hypothetical protein